MKYIQTVTGPINPDDMGFTLPHEHIFWNLTLYLPEDLDLNDPNDARNQKVSLDNLCDVKYNFQKYSDNVIQQDLDVAVRELQWFKEAGGRTICDCTVRGINGDPMKLKAASERSGINIVLGTGAYGHMSLAEDINALDKYDMAELFVKDFREGIDETGIKPGFIKVAVTNGLPDKDCRSLAAAAIAQKQTGACILIHQPGTDHSADEIFEILLSHGGDITRTAMCHCCPLLPDHDYIDYIAKSGAYISFDFFGLNEAVLGKTLWLPTDRDRLLAITEQIKRGNINKLLISNDTVYKSLLRQFGGYGYAHIPRNMWPLMLANGFTQNILDQISIHNPRELFAIDT